MTICETYLSAPTGAPAGTPIAELRDRASVTRDAAWQHISDVPLAEAQIGEGRPVPAPLEVLDRGSATLLAVGTHGGGHIAGMPVGSVATSMLQQAPCPVLVGRGSDDPAWSPDSIVVGMDGLREASGVGGDRRRAR